MLNLKKRRVRILIVVTVVVVLPLGGLVASAHVADSLRYTHVTSSLVGVWMGEKGNVFELRADGTGCGVGSADNADTMFFRWNERDGTLTTFFEPKQKSLAQKLELMLRGLPKCAISSFRIERANDGVLQLFDLDINTSFSFARTNNEAFALKHSQSKSVKTASVDWQKRVDLRDRGLRECESFRQSLLQTATDGTTRGRLIGAAIERFPELCKTSLRNRPDLAGFHVSSQDFVRQIAGHMPVDKEVAFGRFTGRWYGLWDQMRVDHDWQPVRFHDPSMVIAEDLPQITALQYCWIGDGFGWNYVAEVDDRPSSQVILGMVYHLDQEAKIRLRRPHVGYCAGPGKLIWVTAKEIFFEEILPPKGDDAMAYAITGVAYKIHGKELTNDGDAFQAIYTQHPDQRPPWYKFHVDLRVSAN